MTVADVWGRVQGQDALPLSHDGDDWFFPAPPGISGTLVCEFWAEDEAGNIGYRAALITLHKGAIKCWRWLDAGCSCIMLATIRPVASVIEGRPEPRMTLPSLEVTDLTCRPECIMHPHVCYMAGEV